MDFMGRKDPNPNKIPYMLQPRYVAPKPPECKRCDGTGKYTDHKGKEHGKCFQCGGEGTLPEFDNWRSQWLGGRWRPDPSLPPCDPHGKNDNKVSPEAEKFYSNMRTYKLSR